jgi:hypothetical protein
MSQEQTQQSSQSIAPRFKATAVCTPLYMGRDGDLCQGTLHADHAAYSYTVTAYSEKVAQARVIPGPFHIKPNKQSELQSALPGSWILALHVRDSEKNTVLHYEQGAWAKGPKTEEEHAIVETLKHMYPPVQPKPQPVPVL